MSITQLLDCGANIDIKNDAKKIRFAGAAKELGEVKANGALSGSSSPSMSDTLEALIEVSMEAQRLSTHQAEGATDKAMDRYDIRIHS
jgi:hypothetical protein